MTENKNDQPPEPAGSSCEQSIERSSDLDLSTANIKIQELQKSEELDIVITDQRRPQFRSSENYGRRNRYH